VVPNVRVIDDRKPLNQQSSPSDWLFDTGASTTIIGTELAESMGIDLANEIPVGTVKVEGVGGRQRQLKGYRIDELIFPMINGDDLIFEDAIVFVPEVGALPADLPGIVGMNLFAPAFSEQDRIGLPTDTSPSRFSDWYVDSINGVLSLVDPGSSYVATPRLDGDFNVDNVVDLLDVDLLGTEIAAATNNNAFDLDGDGLVNQADLDQFLGGDIISAGNMLNGDTNFDGEVTFDDFLVLSANFGQSDKKWSEGDFAANGQVEFTDFLALSNNFGASTATLTSVPEPSSALLAILGLAFVLGRKRRCRWLP
jgi:hypothetical protein